MVQDTHRLEPGGPLAGEQVTWTDTAPGGWPEDWPAEVSRVKALRCWL